MAVRYSSGSAGSLTIEARISWPLGWNAFSTDAWVAMALALASPMAAENAMQTRSRRSPTTRPTSFIVGL